MDSKVSLNLVKNWQALCNDIVFSDIAPSLLQNRVITIQEYQSITSESEIVKMENLLLLLLKKNEAIILRFGESLVKDYSWLAEKVMEGCAEKCKEEGSDEIDASPFTQIDDCKTFENDITTEDEKPVCYDFNDLNNINRNNLNSRINIKSGKMERRRIIKSRMKNRLRPKIPNSEAVISSTTEYLKPQKNEEITYEAIKIIKNCSLLSKSWTTFAHSLGLTDRVHDIRFRVVHHGEDLNMCVVYLIREWLEMHPKEATLSKLIEVLRSENFNRVADQLVEMQYKTPVKPNSRV